jgi:hypothetical protein
LRADSTRLEVAIRLNYLRNEHVDLASSALFFASYSTALCHSISASGADLGNPAKPNASARRVRKAETETNNQAKSRKREFGKFDKAIHVFTAAEKSDNFSVQRIRWDMGWNGKLEGFRR